MNLPEHYIESSSGTFSRKIWILDPPDGEPDHIAIFLDGELYLERMDAALLIHQLQANEDIPRLACLFISYVDGAARHSDLTCSKEYSDFVTRDVMPWVRLRHPAIPEHDHFIGGVSLSGLQASYIALNQPQLFKYCLSQSGSYWWNDEWLTSQLDEFPNSETRFWSSVGDLETDVGVSHPPTPLKQKVTQVAACTRFAEGLASREIAVYQSIYNGGHDPKLWKAELPAALRWLFTPEANRK